MMIHSIYLKFIGEYEEWTVAERVAHAYCIEYYNGGAPWSTRKAHCSIFDGRRTLSMLREGAKSMKRNAQRPIAINNAEFWAAFDSLREFGGWRLSDVPTDPDQFRTVEEFYQYVRHLVDSRRAAAETLNRRPRVHLAATERDLAEDGRAGFQRPAELESSTPFAMFTAPGLEYRPPRESGWQLIIRTGIRRNTIVEEQREDATPPVAPQRDDAATPPVVPEPAEREGPVPYEDGPDEGKWFLTTSC